MKKQIGKKGLALIMKVGYNKCTVRFAIEDYTPTEKDHRPSGEYVKYASIEFSHYPTLQELHEAVEAAHNADITETIVNGFEYEGAKVALTIENQTNFAALLAVGTFPATVKIGTGYKTFATKTEFKNFYTACRAHIDETLASGRAVKDAYDWEAYAEALHNIQ